MTQVFQVANIKCQGCVSAIRDALQQLPGVKEARPDQAGGKVEVDFEADIINPEAVVHKLKEIGYPAIDKP